MTVDLGGTQITVADTAEFRGVRIGSEATEVEVVSGCDDVAPAIRVDSRSVWTV